jgi:hypothetical protein
MSPSWHPIYYPFGVHLIMEFTFHQPRNHRTTIFQNVETLQPERLPASRSAPVSAVPRASGVALVEPRRSRLLVAALCIGVSPVWESMSKITERSSLSSRASRPMGYLLACKLGDGQPPTGMLHIYLLFSSPAGCYPLSAQHARRGVTYRAWIRGARARP